MPTNRRSLNWPLILLSYLLLLQLGICWYYHSHVAVQINNWPYIFTIPAASYWLMLLDLVRPLLLILLFSRSRPLNFYIVAGLLFFSWRDDLHIPFFKIASTVELEKGFVPAEPLSDWQVNLYHNPLSLPSLIYEILMRLLVVMLVLEPAREREQNSRQRWSFSLVDGLVFMSLLAVTIAVNR